MAAKRNSVFSYEILYSFFLGASAASEPNSQQCEVTISTEMPVRQSFYDRFQYYGRESFEAATSNSHTEYDLHFTSESALEGVYSPLKLITGSPVSSSEVYSYGGKYMETSGSFTTKLALVLTEETPDDVPLFGMDYLGLWVHSMDSLARLDFYYDGHKVHSVNGSYITPVLFRPKREGDPSPTSGFVGLTFTDCLYNEVRFTGRLPQSGTMVTDSHVVGRLKVMDEQWEAGGEH